MLRLVKWLGIALCVALGLLLISNWRLVMIAVNQPQLFFPADFDHTPPAVSRIGDQRHLLVFSKTNGYRHHDAIPAAQHMLEQIAANNSWFVFATENAAVFNDKTLREFDVVVLNNSSGTLYTSAQQLALRQFLETGGGLVALHAAGGDTRYGWSWYADQLIRARFVDHPMSKHLQSARLMVHNPAHPVVAHLEREWQRTDEWYNFAAMPGPDIEVLISIDEASYDPERSPMGAKHPLVWSHQIGSGKVVYSAMGHTVESYQEPGYLKLVTQAIHWVAPKQ